MQYFTKQATLKRLPARKTANKHLSVINRAWCFSPDEYRLIVKFSII